MEILTAVEAEQNVIGYLIRSKDAKKHIENLSPSHFSDNDLRTMFIAVQALFLEGKEINFLNVVSETQNLKQTIPIPFITEIISRPELVSFTTNYDILEEKRKKREIKDILDRASRQLFDNINSEDIQGVLIQEIQEIDRANSIDDSPSSRVKRTWEQIESSDPKKRRIWQAGIAELDMLTGGIYPSDLTIIAASSGVGKTALALQISRNLSRNLKCLFVSREMKESRIDFRLLASITGIPSRKIRDNSLSDEERAKIKNVLFKRLANDNLIINDRIASLSEIKYRLRKEPFDCLVVDYIQLVEPENRNETREQQVAKISRGLKNIAMEFQIAVIALTQLNEDGASRESRAIYFDSDNYIEIKIPSATDFEAICKKDSSITPQIIAGIRKLGNEVVQIVVKKQRDGETGRFLSVHEKAKLEFRSYNEVQLMIPLPDREGPF